MLRAVETRRCAKCGATLLADASYCISCGSAVGPDENARLAPDATEEAAARIRHERAESTSRLAEAFPLIAAAVLALVGAALFVAVLWPDTPAPNRRDTVTAPAPSEAPATPEAREDRSARSEAVPPTSSSAGEAPGSAERAPSIAQAPPDQAPPRQPALGQEPPRALQRAPETPRAAALPGASAGAMVAAAIEGEHTQVQQLARELASKRRARGDRPRARQFNAQGLSLMSTARYAEAVPAFEAAHQADPGDAEVRENLGYALLKAGRIDKAEQALLSALEIGPRRASAWGSLGFVYAKQGRQREAVQLILTAYRFAPSRRKALESYTRQASTDPDPKVRATLAEALNRVREAR
jgi:tetratricopeptide (TPR) repeat protein